MNSIMILSYKTFQVLDPFSPLSTRISQSLPEFFQSLIVIFEAPQIFLSFIQVGMRVSRCPLNLFLNMPFVRCMLLGLLEHLSEFQDSCLKPLPHHFLDCQGPLPEVFPLTILLYGFSELLVSLVEIKPYPCQAVTNFFFLFFLSSSDFSSLRPICFSLCLRLNLSSFLSRVTRLSLRCNFSFSFSSLEMVALSSSVSRIGTCVGSGIGVE